MKRAQVRRTVQSMKTTMSKPFQPDEYVATFSDTALREALSETTYPSAPLGGVLAALHKTLCKTLTFSPGALARMAPQLVFEEAARRWAVEYDRAVKAHLRESKKKKSKRRQPKTRKHR